MESPVAPDGVAAVGQPARRPCAASHEVGVRAIRGHDEGAAEQLGLSLASGPRCDGDPSGENFGWPADARSGSRLDRTGLGRAGDLHNLEVPRAGRGRLAAAARVHAERTDRREDEAGSVRCTRQAAPDWRAELTPEQYRVLREKGTEQAFTGDYWDEHGAGEYRCAGCGGELFDAEHEVESGSGWPSFYQPLDLMGSRPRRTVLLHDADRGALPRCGGDLGHIFDDARDQPTGLRYCINSAAMKLDRQRPTEPIEQVDRAQRPSATARITFAAARHLGGRVSRWVTARTVRGPNGVEQDAALAAALDEGRGVGHAAPLDEGEDDDVRLDGGEVELDVVAAQQLLGEQAGVGVVVGQALDVVGQRVRAGRREDAGLAHRPARHAPVPVRACDQRGATRPAATRPGSRGPC